MASTYGMNPNLSADRIKITKKGVEIRKLIVKPGILNNVFQMMNNVIYLMSKSISNL
jgi:hypothetical protein